MLHGFHGQVQHDFLVSTVRLQCQFASVRRVWEKGIGNCTGQTERAFVTLLKVAQVIDNDGYCRLNGGLIGRTLV